MNLSFLSLFFFQTERMSSNEDAQKIRRKKMLKNIIASGFSNLVSGYNLCVINIIVEIMSDVYVCLPTPLPHSKGVIASSLGLRRDQQQHQRHSFCLLPGWLRRRPDLPRIHRRPHGEEEGPHVLLLAHHHRYNWMVRPNLMYSLLLVPCPSTSDLLTRSTSFCSGESSSALELEASTSFQPS